jgi:hypothetical protein
MRIPGPGRLRTADRWRWPPPPSLPPRPRQYEKMKSTENRLLLVSSANREACFREVTKGRAEDPLVRAYA